MVSEYPRFAEAMARFGYDWEAHKVATTDDYILTTFHVLGRTGEPRMESDKGSVLIQHGSFGDAAVWVGSYTDTTPFMLQLAD